MGNLQRVLVDSYIVASVLIIAVNLAVIALILCSPALRQKSRNLIIVSIALADLMMGCFVTPMLATALTGSYTADCYTHLAVQVIGDHGVLLIVGWELITFNLLHIKENSKRFPWKNSKLPVPTCVKKIALVMWPWLATLCILVPLVVENPPIEFSASTDDVMCLMVLSHSVLVAVCFISLYLPFYLCVTALVVIVVCYSNGCHSEQPTTLIGDINSNLSEEASEHTQEQATLPRKTPLAATVPNIVYLTCYMPLIVHTWLHFSRIFTPGSVFGMTIFGLLARSVILPLSWLVFPDIRHEVSESFRRLKQSFNLWARHSPPSTSSAVTFSRLQEAQTI